MSTNINANVLKNFIIKTVGADHLTQKAAQKVGISQDQFNEANADENQYLELDEILQDNDLYEQFATMYVEEKENKDTAKGEEAEKKEQTEIKGKNGAGV